MFETLIYYGSVALAAYKIFAIAVTALCVFGIVYVAKKSAEMRRIKTSISGERGTKEDRKEDTLSPRVLSELRNTTRLRWQQIIEQLGGSQSIKDFKTAIIEADALVDTALRAREISGETMADRLQAIPVGRLSHLDDIWKAHRVRNNIAHDPHYSVSPREGHDIMSIYKKALEELGAL